MERYFSRPSDEIGYNPNEIPMKCKPNKAIFDGDEGKASDTIDCNICLDLVNDPVVTFCGHLYCWPCIYKWIRFQSGSSDRKTPHCPVCKAEISEEKVIPLYVNGLSTDSSKGKALYSDIEIPQRPQSPRQDVYHRMTVATPPPTGRRAQPYLGGGGVGGGGEGIVNHLGMAMFGEMVYARIFGNSETRIYAYPNSYNLVSTNHRIRRHLMEADTSLSRLTFFLICCMFLCLILF